MRSRKENSQAGPIFLTKDQILAIHRQGIIRYSEQPIRPYDEGSWIRDDVLLESALFAPQATFGGEFLFDTVAAMAGAYWHSLTINHAFTDGNKKGGSGRLLDLSKSERF